MIRRFLLGTTDQVCNQQNEAYMSCGSACPKTCEDVFKPYRPMACSMQCVPGCFCQDGYVRNTVTNECVDEASCKMPRDVPPSGNDAAKPISPKIVTLVLSTLLVQNIVFRYVNRHYL